VAIVDDCVRRLTEFIVSNKGTVIVTADHGNAEKMIDENGGVHSAHTTNDVPFILVSPDCKDIVLRQNGKLCDIAPTILEIMDLPIPMEMTGKSLIKSQ
jgi:2,3-bisphosphoglycerate-independent phosphoglycerate mutase